MTPDQLAKFAPQCDAAVLAPAVNQAAAARDISTPLRMAHWLGQLHEETGGFTVFEENLNYSAERLCAVWPSRFKIPAAAQPYAHHPEALANMVYGGRMGNTQPGDGWLYRGRGGIMITGRANYDRVGKEIGQDLVAHPEHAAWLTVWPQIAAAFWSDHHLNALADTDDVTAITRAVNGGLTRLDERKAQVARAKAILAVPVQQPRKAPT